MTDEEKAAKILTMKASAFDAIRQVAQWQKKAQELEQAILALEATPPNG